MSVPAEAVHGPKDAPEWLRGLMHLWYTDLLGGEEDRTPDAVLRTGESLTMMRLLIPPAGWHAAVVRQVAAARADEVAFRVCTWMAPAAAGVRPAQHPDRRHGLLVVLARRGEPGMRGWSAEYSLVGERAVQVKPWVSLPQFTFRHLVGVFGPPVPGPSTGASFHPGVSR